MRGRIPKECKAHCFLYTPSSVVLNGSLMGKQNFAIGVILCAIGLVAVFGFACAQEPYAVPPAYQPRAIDEQTLNLYREQLRLGKAELALKILEKRQAIEDERQQALDAAAIIERIGDLDIKSPTYEKDRAEILARHVVGLDLAKDFIKQKDDLWEAQQMNHPYAAAATKAAYAEMAEKYHLTDGDLDAIDALPPGTVKYLDAAGNSVRRRCERQRE